MTVHLKYDNFILHYALVARTSKLSRFSCLWATGCQDFNVFRQLVSTMLQYNIRQLKDYQYFIFLNDNSTIIKLCAYSKNLQVVKIFMSLGNELSRLQFQCL